MHGCKHASTKETHIHKATNTSATTPPRAIQSSTMQHKGHPSSEAEQDKQTQTYFTKKQPQSNIMHYTSTHEASCQKQRTTNSHAPSDDVANSNREIVLTNLLSPFLDQVHA